MQISFNAYRITALALFTGMLSLQPLFASAQANYPNKTVKMIVPLTPGSGADIAGRIVAKNLAESWKQPVIIENRPGAGGLVGTGVVVNSDPDGYTLLVQSASYAANPAIYKKLPYDLKSLKDVNILGTSPYALVVSAESPYKSLKDLVNAAKSKPEIIPFASAGVGSSTHLAAEYFNQTMGIKMLHVPYKGSPEAITETIAGRTAFYMAPFETAMAQVRGGKARALGITSIARASVAPERGSALAGTATGAGPAGVSGSAGSTRRALRRWPGAWPGCGCSGRAVPGRHWFAPGSGSSAPPGFPGCGATPRWPRPWR